jgi:hypothetical protein
LPQPHPPCKNASRFALPNESVGYRRRVDLRHKGGPLCEIAWLEESQALENAIPHNGFRQSFA